MASRRESHRLTMEDRRTSSCMTSCWGAARKRPCWKSVMKWLTLQATPRWTNLGKRWRVHWRRVSVVWESKGDILCVCLMLLRVWVACRWESTYAWIDLLMKESYWNDIEMRHLCIWTIVLYKFSKCTAWGNWIGEKEQWHGTRTCGLHSNTFVAYAMRATDVATILCLQSP